MNAKQLRKHFGSHDVPPLLDALVAFSNKNDGSFSGQFELSDFDGEDVAELMVGHYADGVARFGVRIRERLALFGCDADGSQYGFWFDAGQPAAKRTSTCEPRPITRTPDPSDTPDKWAISNPTSRT